MMNDKNPLRNPSDQNQVVWYQSLVVRLSLAFILVAVVPLIIGGISSIFTMQQANAAAIQQSETAMTELGATAVFERAKATADQIALYLETIPNLI